MSRIDPPQESMQKPFRADRLRSLALMFAQVVEERKEAGKGTAIEVLGEDGRSEIIIGVGVVGIKDDVALLVTPNYGPKQAQPCTLCEAETLTAERFDIEAKVIDEKRRHALKNLEHQCGELNVSPTGDLERKYHAAVAMLNRWGCTVSCPSGPIHENPLDLHEETGKLLGRLRCQEDWRKQPSRPNVRAYGEDKPDPDQGARAPARLEPAILVESCNLCGEPLDDVNGACKGPHNPQEMNRDDFVVRECMTPWCHAPADHSSQFCGVHPGGRGS